MSSAGVVRSRRPGRVNLVLMLLLLLIVIPLALHVATPPPPEVQAFNPSEQQIKEAPVSQATQTGNARGLGSGGAGGGGAGVTPTSGVNLALVRHCVRARQTEDPQSPPCVNYFGGNNGGSTWPGVTKDTIRVAVPTGTPIDPSMVDMEKYFNARFEFYGRKIQLVPYTPTPKGASRSGDVCSNCDDYPDASAQTHDAQMLAHMNVFAATGYESQMGDQHWFWETLAKEHIMGITSDTTLMTENDYDKYAPYLWNYYPADDTNQQNLGAYICDRLHGFLAKYTQAPLNGRTRKLGLIIGEYPDGIAPDLSILHNSLAACGIKPGASGSDQLVESTIVYGAGDQDFTNSVALFNNPVSPVTTVLCYCYAGVLNDGMYHRWVDEADSQNYYPEYLANPFHGQDNDTWLVFMPPCDKAFHAFCASSNVQHMFGMLEMTKWDQFYSATMPCGYAAREVDPGIAMPPFDCLDTESSTPANAYVSFGYQSMLLLASGIQMAGARLTPQAFQQGLFNAHFENPDCDGPPLYQSCVGFGPHDHTMSGSYVEVWGSGHDHTDDVQSQFQDTYCYGELSAPHGLRYRLPRPGDAVPARTWVTGRDTQYFFGEPCH